MKINFSKFSLILGIILVCFLALTAKLVPALGATAPTLATVNPSSGPVGSMVTLSGFGFSATDNTIKFGSGYIHNLNSSTGSSLQFVVPDGLDLCAPNTTICPQAYQMVTPGSYSVSVINANGNSNSLTFTVTQSSTSPTPTPSPIPPLVNHNPIGYFDGVRLPNGIVYGWSFDPDSPSNESTLQLFINGRVGSGTLMATTTTNVLRPDVNLTFGISGTHGFEFVIPNTYRDNKIHSLYVYSIDANDSAKSTLLPGSPKNFKISSSVNPAPTPTPTPQPAPTPTPNPSPASYKDGTLLIDNRIIYILEYGRKRPFASLNAFQALGYRLSDVVPANTSGIVLGSGVFTAQQRHSRGVLVNINGTIYFMGTDYRYPFPSEAVLKSWGNNFREVVPGNSYDEAVPLGSVITTKI